MEFRTVKRSLRDLVGEEYLNAVCRARAYLTGESIEEDLAKACEPIDFWPRTMQQRLHALLPKAGQQVIPPLSDSPPGAGTAAFQAASKRALAPLSGFGYYRIGEDGLLYVLTKSEHYHVLLGHAFPGYRLLERARELGIPNATHNNTRGAITRRLEASLVQLANGLDADAPIDSLASDQVSRVLNLSTGSLAAETALKLVLQRFYGVEADDPAPYADRVPVIVVVGNDAGGIQANYHGTTWFPQMLRGMWPEMARRMEAGILRVVAVRPNAIEDLETVFREHDRAPTRIAGFFHEIVMMNYGALTLTPAFLERAYALCREHDVPTVVDEIQSCLWYPEGFLYRRYGLRPSIVVVGKGFSGGEYAASRILLTEPFDRLLQFGALVTNGQEELAALAYLISMAWASENRSMVAAMGNLIESSVRELVHEFPNVLADAAGIGHLMGLWFHDVDVGKRFADMMVQRGFDLSVQSYKSICPPAALTKLPLIADPPLVEHMLDTMRDVLRQQPASRT